MTGHTGNELNVASLSDALASSVEEKPLMEISQDATSLPVASPVNSSPMLYDSDDCQDPGFSLAQPMPDLVMLLDTGDEASSHQVPCLIPKPSGSQPSENVSDPIVSAPVIPVDAADASIPNGSVQEPAQNQMFDFVNDMMRSSSPDSPSTSLYLRSRAAKKGGDHRI